MQTQAVIPTWVVPPPRQVADCHRLAYAAAMQIGGHRYQAITATVSWVTGGQPSPMTEHAGEVSTEVARNELRAADSRRGITDNQDWSAGVAVTLAWLLGLHRTPPVQLPRRVDDGSTPTAEQLYAEYIAGTFGEPEARKAARDKAEQDAARYRRLAEIADGVH